MARGLHPEFVLRVAVQPRGRLPEGIGSLRETAGGRDPLLSDAERENAGLETSRRKTAELQNA